MASMKDFRDACNRFFRERGMVIKTFRDQIDSQARKGQRVREDAEDAEERDEQALQGYLDGDGEGDKKKKKR